MVWTSSQGHGHGLPNSRTLAKVGALDLHPTLILPRTPPMLSHRPTPAPRNPSSTDTAMVSPVDAVMSHRHSRDVTH